MTPADLSRLSTLLDEALDLPVSEREAWLAALDGEAATLAPTLRNLLARSASRNTADLLQRGPSFTVIGGDAAGPAFAVGHTVGPYRLLRELGRGGMGEVWLAERSDGQLKRQVALKLPMPGLRRSMLVERFARERDILGGLVHPHIARLYDAGIAADGQPYMALEVVEGTSLGAYCDQHRLGTVQRLALAMQVLDAVQYAHTRLVIHRDLKPANIFVTDDGQVRLLDFGVAKLLAAEDGVERTQLTQLAGQAFTPDYASPEQVRGDTLGTASDVYSLGVVLYELLCGRRPYKLKLSSAAQLEQAILEAEPQPPSSCVDAEAATARSTTAPKLRRELHGELDTIVLKALKKKPEERYGTAAALAEDLRRYREGEPVLARPDSFAYRAGKFIRRNKLAAGSVTAVVLAIGGGLGGALWQYRQAIEQARIAREEARTAAAVQGFMEDIFTANSTDQTDPAKARKTTAEELLDIAGRKMEEAMLDAPKARLRMLNVLNGLYSQLGLSDKAVTAAKLALDLTSRRGFTVLDQLDSLGRYVSALGTAGRYAESDQWQARREALAREWRISDPLVLGRIAIDRANLDYEKNHPVEAFSHADEALGLLRKSGDKAALVDALTLQAVIAGHITGREPLALSALQEAKELVEGEGGRLNASLMEIYGQLSEVSTRLDDPAGAVSYAKQAFALAKAAHTPDEDMARYESRAVAKALSYAGRPLEALEYLDKAWQLSDPSRPETKSFIQYGLLIRWGVTQVETGRAEAALVTTERLRRLREAMPELKGNPQETVIRVTALRELGQLDAADDAWQALMRNAPPEINAARLGWASVAEMNLSRANATQARAAVLDAVSHQVVGTSLRPRLEADFFLARAALIEGQLDEVDRLTGEALKRIEAFAQRGALADLEAKMLWIRSRMLLERHDAAAALPLAQRAVALFEAVVDPAVSLKLARILGSLAQAQFMTGHADQARDTFRRMKTIHEQHRNIGPTVRAELASVARELSARS